MNLPANVPPLDVIRENGGSIDVNGVTKIVEGGASQLPAFAGALTYWRGSFNAIFTVSGTSSSDQSGSFNPTSGNININPTLVTSRDFGITRGQVIQTVAHELRHGYQQAQIRQTGQVSLGIARDPKTGQVTWMTMNKAQFEAESRKLGGTSDRRTYALSPIEIDARIFAEWMRRDYK